MIDFLRILVFLSRESHWSRGRLATRRLKLQAISSSGSGTRYRHDHELCLNNRKLHSYKKDIDVFANNFIK